METYLEWQLAINAAIIPLVPGAFAHKLKHQNPPIPETENVIKKISDAKLADFWFQNQILFFFSLIKVFE